MLEMPLTAEGQYKAGNSGFVYAEPGVFCFQFSADEVSAQGNYCSDVWLSFLMEENMYAC